MDIKIINIVQENLKYKFNETIKNLNDNNFNISKDDIEIPAISYELTGRAAGKASSHKNIIKLNKDLILNPKYFKKISETTLYHELAHIFVGFLYTSGRLHKPNILTQFKQRPKPHGNEWKTLMILMGQEPRVTHDFEITSARKTERITYTCDCSEHEMTKLAYNKMKRGATYTCKKCKTPLKIKPGASFKKI